MFRASTTRIGIRIANMGDAVLQHYWKHHHHLQLSRRTMRRALRQEGYRYKRPRYVLARRSPTLHQAKGGSNEG